MSRRARDLTARVGLAHDGESPDFDLHYRKIAVVLTHGDVSVAKRLAVQLGGPTLGHLPTGRIVEID